MTILECIPSSKEKKVLIECDFKISEKCKLKYKKVYKNVLKGRLNNNGKDRCQYCFNKLTKRGANNYNFLHIKNEFIFDILDTELKAYLLGWIAGDGSVKQKSLSLSVHTKDKEILDLFQESIAPTCNRYIRQYDNTDNIQINSAYLVESICNKLKIQPGKKSHKIIIPDNMDDKLKNHYIRGLMDSDGHIGRADLSRRYPNCSYCSISDIIKNQIINICSDNNIKCYKTGYSISWGGFEALKFLNFIYSDSHYFLKRKYNLYLEWLTWVPYKGTKNFPAKYKRKNA